MGEGIPDYGFAQCDGHHEMVDLGSEKRPIDVRRQYRSSGEGLRARRSPRIWLASAGRVTVDHQGQSMKRLTSAQLFAAPKSAGKAKARLERAKLVIAEALR